jgi:hypothetical protein
MMAAARKADHLGLSRGWLVGSLVLLPNVRCVDSIYDEQYYLSHCCQHVWPAWLDFHSAANTWLLVLHSGKEAGHSVQKKKRKEKKGG